MRVWSLGQEDPLENSMATHSSILAWRIPWTEETDGLQSMRLPRVGHSWMTERAQNGCIRFKDRSKPGRVSKFSSSHSIAKLCTVSEKTQWWGHRYFFCFQGIYRLEKKKANILYIYVCVCACVCTCAVLSCFIYVRLCWDPKDYSLPGSSAHGILQARIPEWIAIPFSRGYSQPRDRTGVS